MASVPLVGCVGDFRCTNLGVLSIAAVPASAAAARTETLISANMVMGPSTTGSSARTAALSVPAGPSCSGLAKANEFRMS